MLDTLDMRRVAELLAENPVPKEDLRGGPRDPYPWRDRVERLQRELQRAGFEIVRVRP
jgi:hypothetical protein